VHPAAGELPDEERVDRAEGEMPGIREPARASTWSSTQAILVAEK